MNQREYHMGPGAVSMLLIIVIVSMSVLGLLSVISARGDRKLSIRTREFIEAEWIAAAEAERKLALLDAILAECIVDSKEDAEYIEKISSRLPDGFEICGREISWYSNAEDERTLRCTARVNPLGCEERYSVISHIFELSEYTNYEMTDFDIWE